MIIEIFCIFHSLYFYLLLLRVRWLAHTVERAIEPLDTHNLIETDLAQNPERPRIVEIWSADLLANVPALRKNPSRHA